MKYPVKITRSKINSGYELSVPDLPGCQIKGDSIEFVMSSVKQAIAEHLQILAEYGEAIPHASMIDNLIAEQPNVIWALVDFDITPYLGKSHKINVTLPELLIKQIDDRVNKSEHYKTRSGFIASACIAQLTSKS